MPQPTNIGNDSTQAGYLLPQTHVLDDDELLDLYQPIVFGIGGWQDSSLVRPRWQTPDVPNEPPLDADWASFGIKDTRKDTFSAEFHVDDSMLGYDLVEYSEEIDLLISCFGPLSQSYARRLSDGFKIEQNRAVLNSVNTDVLYVSKPVTLPMLLHGAWRRRVDITITLRRYLSIKYNVRTLVEASGSVDTEQFVDTFIAGTVLP